MNISLHMTCQLLQAHFVMWNVYHRDFKIYSISLCHFLSELWVTSKYVCSFAKTEGYFSFPFIIDFKLNCIWCHFLPSYPITTHGKGVSGTSRWPVPTCPLAAARTRACTSTGSRCSLLEPANKEKGVFQSRVSCVPPRRSIFTSHSLLLPFAQRINLQEAFLN